MWRNIEEAGKSWRRFIGVSAISVKVIDAYRTAVRRFSKRTEKRSNQLWWVRLPDVNLRPERAELHMISNRMLGHLMGSWNFGRQARKERVSVAAL